MFYIIDGTGEDDDYRYFKEMEHGFCFNLFKKLNNQNSEKGVEVSFSSKPWIDSKASAFVTGAVYLRGPVLNGHNTFDIASRMLKNFILPNFKKNESNQKSDSIFLVGHSRGGAAVNYIAYKLSDLKINVKAMFLFDAVDKTFNMINQFNGSTTCEYDLEFIPNNVKTLNPL